jgi:2-oxoglutarate ferredoxin oxidoreductase subunit delta
MADVKKPDRGKLEIDTEECKGCGLCIEACPPRVIGMSERLNHFGYRTAVYAGAGCTGCGICFMACPEPGAITVYRLARGVMAAQSHRFRDEAAEKDGATGSEGAMECASN